MAATTPSGSSEAERVLAQYATFWTLITPASRAAPSSRRAMLAPYATDPELSRLLRGLLATDAVDQQDYGAPIPHARVTTIRGNTAGVFDCQDASRAGLASRSSGRRLTRGVSRNPVNATLLRGPDGQWRMSTVEFPGGSC